MKERFQVGETRVSIQKKKEKKKEDVAQDCRDRKLKRAVNRSFGAISDSTSFGRRREMTAQEKPHWSAETARKNTVGQPLLCPTAASNPRESSTDHPHLNPTPTISLASGSSPPPRSSSFPRSFPRASYRHTLRVAQVVGTGVVERREPSGGVGGVCSVARLRRSCAHLNNAHNKVCNG